MEYEFIKLIFLDNVEIEIEKNDSYVEIIFGNLWEYLNSYDWFFYDKCVITSEKNEDIEISIGCDEYEEDDDIPRQGTVYLYFNEKLNFIKSDGNLD